MSLLAAEPFVEQLVAIRRHLHEHPELSHEEFETTAFIRKWLTEAGITIVDYSLETGVIAEVGGLHGGPIVAVRADIDALPIQEETGLHFASRNPGKMHACGHDFHTAAILGTALLLKNKEHELQGTVRFLFQPAEEKAKGAIKLIESGALEGVQAVFGMHNKPDLPVGTIGIKSGPIMAAADGFVVEVEGLGTHAAVPEAGIDPIVTSAHIITALQSIVSRNVSALDSAVISVTRLHSGTAWNVIADKATFDGTLRTFSSEVRTKVIARFEQVVAGVAAAFGTKAKVSWLQGPPAVVNDQGWAEVARHSAEAVELQVVQPAPSPAGEDFAFYLKEVPGVFVFLGTSGPEEWHHPAFDVDEQALPIGASFFATLAIDAINKLSNQPH
ncbi:hydrolase [Paenibacillus baekrokdamisoli]|uniref:Hydrolase n=1 Tax=Paenibacillus baekrokdamisoli TaxID=1712516 RepID=A0A3G9IRT5_9BACL|nr:amidohydrolase [Paenibacillus baekrokdamisoli]MBB3071151.1 amidohydrolase [Paenibacillus baekrokdamisoli]BBH21570.1 hydrolase [Paenibacillus baekrokdamisoli]